jgi:hypothetical protein
MLAAKALFGAVKTFDVAGKVQAASDILTKAKDTVGVLKDAKENISGSASLDTKIAALNQTFKNVTK